MIRAEVNVEDFLESFLKVGDIQDNLYPANISYMQETPGKYWEIGMYGLRCNAKIYILWQYFVILFIADTRNQLYLSKLIFFYIAIHIPFDIFCFWRQPLKITPWNRCSPKLSKFLSKFVSYKSATFIKLTSWQIMFKEFSQQTFVLVKTCWRRLQHNIFLSSKTSSRHLQDVQMGTFKRNNF